MKTYIISGIVAVAMLATTAYAQAKQSQSGVKIGGDVIIIVQQKAVTTVAIARGPFRASNWNGPILGNVKISESPQIKVSQTNVVTGIAVGQDSEASEHVLNRTCPDVSDVVVIRGSVATTDCQKRGLPDVTIRQRAIRCAQIGCRP